jgi:hypothetical protein
LLLKSFSSDTSMITCAFFCFHLHGMSYSILSLAVLVSLKKSWVFFFSFGKFIQSLSFF